MRVFLTFLFLLASAATGLTQKSQNQLKPNPAPAMTTLRP